MSAWDGVEGARRPVWQAFTARPLLYCTPLLVSGACYSCLSFVLRRSLGTRHSVLELCVLWLLCVPLSLLAEVVLAKLYLEGRADWRGLAASFDEVLRRRQIAPLVARLFSLVTLWFLVALVPAFLLALLPSMWRAVAFGFHHPGMKLPPSPHNSHLGLTALWLAFACIPISRYAFVAPLFATGRFSAREAMRFGVRLAQANYVLVVALSLLETALTFGFGHPLRQLGHGSWVREFVAGLLALLESSAVETFFEMIKTELAVRLWKSAGDSTPAR